VLYSSNGWSDNPDYSRLTKLKEIKMGRSTFSGPVASINGFVVPSYATDELPTTLPNGDAVAAWTVVACTDGAQSAPCLAMYTGSEWVNVSGAALDAEEPEELEG
jgi:hypothetical protein